MTPLNDAERDAGINIIRRMAGYLASDLWPSRGQGHDEEEENVNYELLAAKWRSLHPDCEWPHWDCAEAWARENKDVILNNPAMGGE